MNKYYSEDTAILYTTGDLTGCIATCNNPEVAKKCADALNLLGESNYMEPVTTVAQLEKSLRATEEYQQNLAAERDRQIEKQFRATQEAQQRPKPPLGLVPRFINDTRRLSDIKAAIQRYLDAGNCIPLEWVAEYNELTREV